MACAISFYIAFLSSSVLERDHGVGASLHRYSEYYSDFQLYYSSGATPLHKRLYFDLSDLYLNGYDPEGITPDILCIPRKNKRKKPQTLRSLENNLFKNQ